MIIGVNAVLRSLKFDEGDALLINTNTYGAVQNTCRYVADRYGKDDWIMMNSIHCCLVVYYVVIVALVYIIVISQPRRHNK